MKRNEKVTSLMSASPAAVQRGQPVSDADAILRKGDFHHLPVVDGTRLVGILSSNDVVIDSTTTVNDVMQSDPICLTAADTVSDAAELLSAGSFHSLPVTNEGGDLLGIVTSTDVIRYLRELY